jgi:hypothetical protein
MAANSGNIKTSLDRPEQATARGNMTALEEEKLKFRKLQEQLAHQFHAAFPDRLAPKTVLIIPSFTLAGDSFKG